MHKLYIKYQYPHLAASKREPPLVRPAGHGARKVMEAQPLAVGPELQCLNYLLVAAEGFFKPWSA
jgi:hypothetical protein